jgi:glycerol uptake facilitator protein
LAVFSTGPAIRNYSANLLSEMIGTFFLMFALMILGANKFSEGLNPLVIGGLIVAIGISFGGTTGFAINPARDLGPRIAHFLLPIPGKGSSDWAYSWVPVAGPLVGGAAGTLAYQALFTGSVRPILIILLIFIAFVAFRAIRNKTVS